MPLKAIVPVPCVAPKFVPLITTDAPTGPEVGFNPLIDGGGPVTVKVTPLLACPPTVTTTGPVAAVAGTGTVIEASLQLLGVAVTPLKVTVLAPLVAPKFTPLIATDVSTSPDVGSNEMIDGEDPVTLNVTGLLAWPSTVTTTGPVRAPAGTLTVILLSSPFSRCSGLAVEGDLAVPPRGPEMFPLDLHRIPDLALIGFQLADHRRRSGHGEGHLIASLPPRPSPPPVRSSRWSAPSP